MGFVMYVVTILATMDFGASIMITTKGYSYGATCWLTKPLIHSCRFVYMSEILSSTSTFLHFFVHVRYATQRCRIRLHVSSKWTWERNINRTTMSPCCTQLSMYRSVYMSVWEYIQVLRKLFLCLLLVRL